MDAYQLGNSGLPKNWNNQKTFAAVIVFMCFAAITVGMVLPLLQLALPGLTALAFFYYLLLNGIGATFAYMLSGWIVDRSAREYHNEFNRTVLRLNKHGGDRAKQAIDKINASRAKRRELILEEDKELALLSLMAKGIEVNIKYNGFEDVVV